jgi:hypothetical protein
LVISGAHTIREEIHVNRLSNIRQRIERRIS